MQVDSILEEINRKYGLHPKWMKHHLPERSEAITIEEAITRLKINETYFWRFSEQFEWVQRSFLPEFIASGRTTLNILSAGCSTGEEAYVLSALCRDYFSQQAPHISYSVTGMDISHNALEKAKSARYTAWSLREMPQKLIDRWLETNEQTWKVRKEYRRNVRFIHGNLFTNEYEQHPGQPFDLILCRNLLIYVDTSHLPVFHKNLAELLGDGGYILLGPADPRPHKDLTYKVNWYRNIPFYQKTATGIIGDAEEVKKSNKTKTKKVEDKKNETHQAQHQVCEILDLIEVKNYRKAFLHLREIMRENPDNPYLIFLNGISLYGMKRKHKANSEMKRALTILSDMEDSDKLPFSEMLTSGQLNRAIQTYINAANDDHNEYY